jgi:hypothetical protein
MTTSGARQPTGERQRARHAEQDEETKSEKEEYDNFRDHGFRPQDARCGGADAGRIPVDDGE